MGFLLFVRSDPGQPARLALHLMRQWRESAGGSPV